MQLELRDYLNVLLKRWWLIVLVAAGAAAAGYGYSKLQTPVYQATVTLQAVPNIDDNALNMFLQSNIAGYAAGLTSRDFVTGVLASSHGRLDDLTPDQVLGRIKVQPQPDSHLIIMTVDDTDPARAAALANALASAYVLQQQAQEQAKQSTGKVFLQQIDQARPPAQPYQPRPLLTAAAAGVLGLVLGLLLAFALEFTDTTLKTAEDVQRYLALTTVGLIPARK